MARLDQEHPLDVKGEWFVDTRCIACDAARHWARDLIASDPSGHSYVTRQAETAEDEASMWRAAMACPTRSIGHRSQRRPRTPSFPYELTPGVLAMGNNSLSSFGAHSYLVRRPDGNLLMDSPRYLPSLAEQVDEMGGIGHVLLSHRDDVADADRWAERYGARIWIHEADSDAAPYATDVVGGSDPVTVAAGVELIAAPGHTRGCVVFHLDQRLLFTGDTLHWNPRREHVDVFPNQTWYSWDVLADSMDVLADLRVEWLFTGHGLWHEVGAKRYAEQMAGLGSSMRDIGKSGWLRRPGTTSRSNAMKV